jgi:hypothetical protein
MSRIVSVAVVAAGLALAAGCGGSQQPQQVNPNKAALEDLGGMLKQLAEQNMKPPARLEELMEPLVPTAGGMLRNGNIVYFWGIGYDAGSTKIAAHEKNAASEGGFVLLQNGTVKEMTAAEFASAPKAK